MFCPGASFLAILGMVLSLLNAEWLVSRLRHGTRYTRCSVVDPMFVLSPFKYPHCPKWNACHPLSPLYRSSHLASLYKYGVSTGGRKGPPRPPSQVPSWYLQEYILQVGYLGRVSSWTVHASLASFAPVHSSLGTLFAHCLCHRQRLASHYPTYPPSFLPSSSPSVHLHPHLHFILCGSGQRGISFCSSRRNEYVVKLHSLSKTLIPYTYRLTLFSSHPHTLSKRPTTFPTRPHQHSFQRVDRTILRLFSFCCCPNHLPRLTVP